MDDMAAWLEQRKVSGERRRRSRRFEETDVERDFRRGQFMAGAPTLWCIAAGSVVATPLYLIYDWLEIAAKADADAVAASFDAALAVRLASCAYWLLLLLALSSELRLEVLPRPERASITIGGCCLGPSRLRCVVRKGRSAGSRTRQTVYAVAFGVGAIVMLAQTLIALTVDMGRGWAPAPVSFEEGETLVPMSLMLLTHALLLPALPMASSTALASLLLPTYAALYAGLWWSHGLPNWLMFAEVAKAAAALALGIFIAIDDEKQTRDDYWTSRLAAETVHLWVLVRQRAHNLLLNTLPEPIVHEIASGNSQFCRRYVSTTVLQCDLVGYTKLTADHTPQQVVDFISELFEAFDVLADRYGVDKVKTIGDAYVVCSGALSEEPEAGHAATVVAMGLEMLDAVSAAADSSGLNVGARIGVHSGELVGGIIGTVRFHFDMWGEAVAGAVAMEEGGAKGSLHISAATARLLPNDLFAMTPVRGDDLAEGSLVETSAASAATSAGAPSPVLLPPSLRAEPSLDTRSVKSFFVTARLRPLNAPRAPDSSGSDGDGRTSRGAGLGRRMSHLGGAIGRRMSSRSSSKFDLGGILSRGTSRQTSQSDISRTQSGMSSGMGTIFSGKLPQADGGQLASGAEIGSLNDPSWSARPRFGARRTPGTMRRVVRFSTAINRISETVERLKTSISLRVSRTSTDTQSGSVVSPLESPVRGSTSLVEISGSITKPPEGGSGRRWARDSHRFRRSRRRRSRRRRPGTHPRRASDAFDALHVLRAILGGATAERPLHVSRSRASELSAAPWRRQPRARARATTTLLPRRNGRRRYRVGGRGLPPATTPANCRS